jgi:hypothetical protein
MCFGRTNTESVKGRLQLYPFILKYLQVRTDRCTERIPGAHCHKGALRSFLVCCNGAVLVGRWVTSTQEVTSAMDVNCTILYRILFCKQNILYFFRLSVRPLFSVTHLRCVSFFPGHVSVVVLLSVNYICPTAHRITKLISRS